MAESESSSAPSADASNCNVVIRVRPQLAAEESVIWNVDYIPDIGGGLQISNEYAAQSKRRQEYYAYDAAFYGSDNRQLYDAVAKDAVDAFMNGMNSVVFAYGQSGSGKTFSMMGHENNPGLIPQAVAQVFDYIKKKDEEHREFLLRISYLEIYNETLKDLLNPLQKDLRIHEDGKRRVFVTPLKEEIVSDPLQAMRIVAEGEKHRRVSPTLNNADSSRSHTIFQLVLESSHHGGNDVVVSNLHLIDLAGSEKANSDSLRQKEGSYINRSLLTLATVISRLTSDEVGEGFEEQHIPFRDSKLTRLLRPSLQGKAKICVVATLNPSARCVEESTNTLKFASRVKRIVSRPEVFRLNEKALLQNYKQEVETLKRQLCEFNQNLLHTTPLKIQDDERARFEEKLEESRLSSIRLKERINHLTKLILTSKSVNITKPLFIWQSSEDTCSNSEKLLARSESIMIEEGLLPPADPAVIQRSSISSSSPSLFFSPHPHAALSLPPLPSNNNNQKIQQEDLTRRKLQALVSFIKSLKRAEDKSNVPIMIQEFKLDTFIERKLSIPDLKLEAALKRVNDLKDEKNQLEVVLIDNAHFIGSLKKKVAELEDLIMFNEKEHAELSTVAHEQQEMIESLHKQLENSRAEFLEYRDLVGKRGKKPPSVSVETIKAIEQQISSSSSSDPKLSDVARHELSNLIAYLRVANQSDLQVLY